MLGENWLDALANSADKCRPAWGFEMATEYRVVDLGEYPNDPKETIFAGATTPEGAVPDASDLVLYRSGSKANLRANIYFQVAGGATSMVRLYTQPGTDTADRG